MDRSQGFVNSIKNNTVGPLVVGLVVSLLFGLVLSFLVGGSADFWPLAILATLLAVATGTAVRLVSSGHWTDLAVAFLTTAMGVNIMVLRGLADIELPSLITDLLGVSGPSFSDSLLVAYGAPMVSVGVILAGLLALIIVGWGPRHAVAQVEDATSPGTHQI